MSLANCQGSGGGSSAANTGINQYGTCTTAGYVNVGSGYVNGTYNNNTTANCVAQGSCPAGYGAVSTANGYQNVITVGTQICAGAVNGGYNNGYTNGYGNPYGQPGIGGGLINPYGGTAYGQYAGQNICGIGAVMTSRGCLPTNPGCVEGGGYYAGRCWF